MAAMLDSQIPMVKAVEILALDELDPLLRIKLDAMGRTLRQGGLFSQGFGYLVPSQYRSWVSQIEYIPNHSEFISRLAVYVEDRAGLISDTVKQLIYPGFILMTTIATLLFFVFVMVPQYGSFFRDTQVAIPTGIQFLIDVNDFASNGVGGLTTGLLLVVGGIVTGLVGRNRLYKFGLGMDSRASLFWILGIMVQAGIPLSKAVSVVSPTSPGIKERWRIFKAALHKSGQFSNNAYLYFNLTRYQKEILLCGERSGTLGKSLESLAEEISRVEKEKLKKWLSRVQPILLVLSAILVLGSVYLTTIPLTSMMNM